MRWFLIPKAGAAQPVHGNYKSWKPQLSIEGGGQCVYCAIPDHRLGGIYVFHVEHFEPKSLAASRTNDWQNLFYACPICNVFKGDDWPANPAHAYLDPSKIDYCDCFNVSPGGGIAGKGTNASYMVERLYLNRPQLIMERRSAALHAKFDALAREIAGLRSRVVPGLDPAVAVQLLMRLSDTLEASRRVVEALRTMPQYGFADVRRP